MTKNANGKGSTQRPVDKDKFDKNYDAIFRKKKEPNRYKKTLNLPKTTFPMKEEAE
jgi:hypothetical protein